MSSPLLQVLIVGCGNMAGGFDANRPADALPLTHAGAFLRHGGFALAACVDPDDDRRHQFAQRWNVPQSAASMAALQAQPGQFDIISICSPTVFHPEHLEAALALRPRLIFCEKPITPSLAATATWVAACEQAGVLLAINHTRRWAPDVQRLAAELAAGQWGQVRSAAAYYNKGILNNGGHMMDLLHLLLGPLDVDYAGAARWDFWEQDPSVPAMLRAGSVPVSVNIAHAADFAHFELQLVTENGIITMEDGGMNWRVRRAIASPHFKGYRALDEGTRTPGQYPHAMLAAATNLHAALTSGQPLASDGRSAMAAQRICELIRHAATGAAATDTPTLTAPATTYQD